MSKLGAALLCLFAIIVIVAALRKTREEAEQSFQRHQTEVANCRKFLGTLAGTGVQRDLQNHRVFVDYRFEALEFARQESIARALACDQVYMSDYYMLDSQTGRRVARFYQGTLTKD